MISIRAQPKTPTIPKCAGIQETAQPSHPSGFGIRITAQTRQSEFLAHESIHRSCAKEITFLSPNKTWIAWPLSDAPGSLPVPNEVIRDAEHRFRPNILTSIMAKLSYDVLYC